MTKQQSSDHYDIGYGRPPKETRFKPGQSGNPKGRKKSPPSSLGEDLTRLLNMPISVVENGNLKKMPTRKALLKKLTTQALKGDVRSIKLLLDMAKEAGNTQSNIQEAEVMSEDDAAILGAYFASRQNTPR